MSEKPQVFHLITRLLKGGAEAKTIQTVRGLTGYEFTVGYGASFDPEQVAKLKAAGIETKKFTTIRHYNPLTAIPAVFDVARHFRQQEYDIVHTHSTEAGIIGRFAAALARVPSVIHTVHGVPFANDRNPMLERFVLYCERAAAHRTDRLIANADAIADDYLERGIGSSNQYVTVYSGIELDTFQNAEPAPDVDGNGVRILSVGRLADGKGFEDLLSALDQLDTDEFSAYIVGDGPLRERLHSLIGRRGLTDTVSLLGYREDVPAIMAACDVFVLPSYREGTPRVITEAMASALPVVATDIAGIPEQVVHGTNGYLLQPGDIDALVKYIDRLCLSEEHRTQFGTTGRERAERFSIEQMTTDLDTVYQDLLDR